MNYYIYRECSKSKGVLSENYQIIENIFFHIKFPLKKGVKSGVFAGFRSFSCPDYTASFLFKKNHSALLICVDAFLHNC